MSARSTHRAFTLFELFIVFAILAVLAVVIVPAFIKYVRRANTHEAMDQVDKIYKSAVVYYTTPQIREGETLPCQFPQNQGVTPVERTCCSTGDMRGNDKNGDNRCDVNPGVWETDTWKVLSFQIEHEHYYTYAFNSAGVYANAAFTASAFGDLDCDGVRSTFQKMGFPKPRNAWSTYDGCEMRGSAVFFIDKETE